MEVLKPGSGQVGWATEAECTGRGCGGGGCAAKMRVEQVDLFRTEDTHYAPVAFQCSECGVATTLTKESGIPDGIIVPGPVRTELPYVKLSSLKLPKRKGGGAKGPAPSAEPFKAGPENYVCTLCGIKLTSTDGVVIVGNLMSGDGVVGVIGTGLKMGTPIEQAPRCGIHVTCLSKFLAAQNLGPKTWAPDEHPEPRLRKRFVEALTALGIKVAAGALSAPYAARVTEEMLRALARSHYEYSCGFPRDGEHETVKELNEALNEAFNGFAAVLESPPDHGPRADPHPRRAARRVAYRELARAVAAYRLKYTLDPSIDLRWTEQVWKSGFEEEYALR